MTLNQSLHVKITEQLRARANTCATLTGATLPEFVRESIRDKCETVERLQGQRDRARKKADAINAALEGRAQG